MIFIFGDSHAEFNFKGINNVINLRQYSITMHRIGRDNTIINFNKNMNNNDNIFIICYGEVDARCHIKRQIDLGRDEDDIINKLITDYINTIKNNIISYKYIIICGVNPPIDVEYYNNKYGEITHEYPILGTNEQRSRWTNKMNKILLDKCNENGFIFFYINDYYCDKYGLIKPELSDNVHIKDNSYIIDKMSKLLSILDNQNKILKNIKNTHVYPISFSIHESKIIKEIKNKTQFFGNYVPICMVQNWDQFKIESDYYNDYAISFYGHTRKKAGWDCMRHYEILANACIPYFHELEKCPENTMTTLPKKLILQGMNLIYKKDDKLNINVDEYNILNKQIFEYTKKYLTTKSNASKFLSYFNNINKVLILTNTGRVDYLYNSVLIGLKEILQLNCIEYPRVEVIYDSYPIENCSKLYGRGFSYSRVLSSYLDINCNRNNIKERIMKHEFDIIINTYDCSEENIELINLNKFALNYYKYNEIIYICGHDAEEISRPLFKDYHDCKYKNKEKDGHIVFIRELG